MKCTALDDGCVDITYLRTQLVLDALGMAIWQRRPKEVIHHSDQDSQYTCPDCREEHEVLLEALEFEKQLFEE